MRGADVYRPGYEDLDTRLLYLGYQLVILERRHHAFHAAGTEWPYIAMIYPEHAPGISTVHDEAARRAPAAAFRQGKLLSGS
jgi:hypothetical protein